MAKKGRWLRITGMVAAMSTTAQLIGGVLIIGGFFVVFFLDVSWITALDPQEALARYHLPPPAGVTAVIESHGHYTEWPFGTIRQNPWGFVLFNLVVIICVWRLCSWGKQSR